jgi:hypothetical protein
VFVAAALSPSAILVVQHNRREICAAPGAAARGGDPGQRDDGQRLRCRTGSTGRVMPTRAEWFQIQPRLLRRLEQVHYSAL